MKRNQTRIFSLVPSLVLYSRALWFTSVIDRICPRARKKQLFIGLAGIILALALTGCGKNETAGSPDRNAGNSGSAENTQTDDPGTSDTAQNSTNGTETSETAELAVCFGDDGEPFILHLEQNDTAAAIARHVGTADWRLPIYHYDDYDNWESMQYYDIPDRYEIPSAPQTITAAKSGEVYYSEPNRIILFYHDAEVSSEYTKVGYFDPTEAFIQAVENNPVLEGWDTKIVLIQSAE